MEDKKFLPISNETTQRRTARLQELEQLLARKQRLSEPEYLDLLEDIRHNWTVMLAIRAVEGNTKDAVALVSILDKVHWMRDSLMGRKQPATEIEIKHRVIEEVKGELKEILGTPGVADQIVQLEQTLIKQLKLDA